MPWLSVGAVAFVAAVVWMAWRRPRQVARVAPFVSPWLKAGRNLPRERPHRDPRNRRGSRA
ncbi:MAG: hypothetical protein M0Z54_10700 [Thermaerobacter sp.]|nr:hypothetical protein [Thermaerobacter sp.]